MKFLGIIAAIVAAVSYGTNPLWAHYLVADGVWTHSMLLGRFVLATAMLGLWAVAARQSLAVPRNDIGMVAAAGCFFGFSSLGLFGAFRFMDSGLSCTLLFVTPVMVAALMASIAKERPGKAMLAAMALALGGVALLTKAGGGVHFSWTGFAFVMFSAICYALYMVTVNIHRIGRLPPLVLTFWTFFSCAILMAAAALAQGAKLNFPHSATGWLNLALLALVPSILSLVAVNIAIPRIGSTATALIGALEPVTGVAIGAIVMGEAFTPRYAAGIGLILASVFATVAKQRERELRPAVQRAAGELQIDATSTHTRVAPLRGA